MKELRFFSTFQKQKATTTATACPVRPLGRNVVPATRDVIPKCSWRDPKMLEGEAKIQDLRC